MKQLNTYRERMGIMTIYRFAPDFAWGAATASYQVEGAANEDGRGPSIWDTFSHTPGKVKNGDNGDIACDSYHRVEEDVRLLIELGVSVYRFSIAWPRVLPRGRGELNRAGVDYYHRLVDKLLESGIEPFCTLYHWDLPQALEDEGGWNSRDTIDAYVDYAAAMFREFKGKIRKWITFNEPWCSSFLSNYIGVHAPGNTDLQLATNIAHHHLVAHGRTVRKFRELGIPGVIGIAPNQTWAVPYGPSEEDRLASLRAIQWTGDWFQDPIFFGRYPEELRQCIEGAGAVIPILDGDMEDIRQPIDFLGLNYYSASVNRYNPEAGLLQSEQMEMGYEKSDIGWPYVAAGLYESLLYVKEKYGDIPIYITENGACINDAPGADSRVRDDRRISYYRQHIASLHRAIESGVNVVGYMAWSLLDNFEWAEGYDKRFGLVHVDFRTLKRTKKDSYYWYEKLARNGWYEAN